MRRRVGRGGRRPPTAEVALKKAIVTKKKTGHATSTQMYSKKEEGERETTDSSLARSTTEIGLGNVNRDKRHWNLIQEP